MKQNLSIYFIANDFYGQSFTYSKWEITTYFILRDEAKGNASHQPVLIISIEPINT